MWPEQGVDWSSCAPVIGQNRMPEPAGKSWLLGGRLASQNGKLMAALTPVCRATARIQTPAPAALRCRSLSRRALIPPPRPFDLFATCVWLRVSMCSSCTFPLAPSLIHSAALWVRSLLSRFQAILSRSQLTSCILIIHYRRLTWAARADFAAVAFPLVCVFMSVWQLLCLK